ncbi:hypothetical protein [Spirosoma endophyticum]|uniref:Uncharacterized protein n=1 Tax=Spirosoma endophyticum TaxID=662367 RepID=A0A1I1PNZ3_9BACT|nr:hypothetical protein [Spirosoma endophyticum]SFD11475.1 hypothetical protein SAMN05216167_103367 [Spirosoma endophyticum]
MRFIAVFYQQRTIYGMGFESVIDANDFLFRGYEDNDLVPRGIYDIMTDNVTPYAHIDQLIGNDKLETIRQFAIEYMKQICQHMSLHER